MRQFAKRFNVLRAIWDDRRLLRDLSLKDVQRRFAGTYFGMIWGLLQPLMTLLVYWAVFQFGFRSGDVGEIPFVLWFMTGMVCWLFISESFSFASNSFIEYNYLIQKVKFNINILPLVKILSSFYIHLFFLGLVAIICILFGYYPSILYVQIAYYAFATIAFVFSLSLLTSSIMVFFRDLGQIINIFLLIGMWGTPICWNMSFFPPKVQNILKMNPFFYLVEGYRDALLGREWFWQKPRLSLYFWCMSLLVMIIGTFVYNRLRIHFADSV